MALPGINTPGWGLALNSFLSVAHNSDGTLKAFVSVKDSNFGATGDGVTDDAAAIQAAIDAMASAGGIVFFPADSTYLIGTPLNINAISSNLVLLGAGWSSILKAKNNLNDYIIKHTSGSMQGARVQYLKFDCNGSNQSAASGGLHGYKWRRCLIEHCWFHNFYETGIFLEGASGDFGYQNDIKSCFIEGGYGQTGKGRGLYLLYTDENTISDCLFQDNGGSDTSQGDNCHIRDDNGLSTYKGNKFVNGRVVFHLFGLQTRITDNIFDGNGGACVQVLSNAKNVIIAHNHFLNVGYIASGGSNNSINAIYVAETECNINHNWFGASAGGFPYTNSFVNIDTGATYSLIEHNIMDVPSGAGTVVAISYVSGRPTGCRVRFNNGYNTVSSKQIWVTENHGNASITSGNTSVAVTHGLSETPTLEQISVTPQTSFGSAAKFWVSNATSTQFTINVDVNPAQTVTFGWAANTGY